MTLNETLKAYLTVNEVIDRCLLSGLTDATIVPTEEVRMVSINNVSLKNESLGMCTIGFIKSQLERKAQLAQRLEQHLKSEISELDVRTKTDLP